MSDRDVLQMYVNMVPFLATLCGSGCEIVVHDATDPEHSLVAIRNGLSGRQIGNPMTDLARELVQQGAYTGADYVANYSGRNKKGDFLSSTYFIKNEGRLIGLLCVNKDISSVQRMNAALHTLLEQFNLELPQECEYTENLDNPVASMMHARIAEIIAEIGVDPARMSMQEKVAAVHRLNEDGVLMMKGAVVEIADQLSVSVPTVYRYLKKMPSEPQKA